MPSKKHLGSQGTQGSQGRRRTNRRRAVQLSEFLRGEDEPAVQLPVPQAESQRTNGSSIGTVPSRDLTASCETVSPVLTPDTPTDEPEKVTCPAQPLASSPPQLPQAPASPPAPSTTSSIARAWQLSAGEGDPPPQGTFVPDHKAFPDLGKQAKKAKALAPPEATSGSTTSLKANLARRRCNVLDNFIPGSREGAAGRDQAVATWLSSVPSAVDKPASCSPPQITILKRAASEQPKSPGCCDDHKLPMQPEISPRKPASNAIVAAVAVPQLEGGLSQRKEQQNQQKKKSNESSTEMQRQQTSYGGASKQKMPENASVAAPESQPQKTPVTSAEQKLPQETLAGSSKQTIPAGLSKQQIPENPSAQETHSLTELQTGEEDVVPASQFSTQNQHQSRRGNRSFWEESDKEETVELACLFQETVGDPLPAIRDSKLNVNAQAFCPVVREQQQRVSNQQQLPESRVERKRRSQRTKRAIKRRQLSHFSWGQAFENPNQLRQQPEVQEGQQQQQQQQQDQSQASAIALPGGYCSAPAAYQRKQQQEGVSVSQRELRQDTPSVFEASPTTPSVYEAPRATSTVYEAAHTAPSVFEASPTTPSIYEAPVIAPSVFEAPHAALSVNKAPHATPSVFEASPTTPSVFEASPTTPVSVAAPATPAISPQSNANASQSVFRMACLPLTGVGTRDPPPPPPMGTLSINPMPSSISGPSQLTHTLSSLAPPEKNLPDCQQSMISVDMFYNRPLMDMDREDTQEDEEEEEQEEQASIHQQWNSNRETQQKRQQRPIDVDDDAGDVRKPIFQSPAAHGEDYPQPDLICIPANIKKLHKTITKRYSDYAFIYTLSAQLGQECVPMDCYVYLKMVLLASIVSIEPDELRPPISLCIIATDSLMANRLMNCLGQLAPRFLGPHEYGVQPTFTGGGGQLSSSRYTWVVASPLLLAQQGVYYAGDWTRLSKEQGEQIEKCIENGTVPVPQLQSQQALEAAIWTHWQPENASNQTVAFAKLCPIFGLPIYMGDGVSADGHDSLWTFLLHQHTKEAQSEDDQADGLNIPEEDIRLLLQLLHQRQVTIDDRAQHMLQKYYVISRKERPTVFTSKTYVVLKQFAESFAKLALRLEVLESDVCVAIFHCEHFVQQIFGAISSTLLPPPPAVNSFRVISHIDPYMNVFARWLQQYLDRYEDHELGMDKAKRRRTDSWEFLY